jgi:hypothetical protein
VIASGNFTKYFLHKEFLIDQVHDLKCMYLSILTKQMHLKDKEVIYITVHRKMSGTLGTSTDNNVIIIKQKSVLTLTFPS